MVEREQESVVVPEFLLCDQSIMDQPPFCWLREDDNILPFDFFVDEEVGFVKLMRFLVIRHDLEKSITQLVKYGEDRDRAKAKEIVDLVSDEHKDAIDITAERLMNCLNAYPYCVEYLIEMWKHRFRLDGFVNRGKPGKNRTYAAYAGIRVKLDNLDSKSMLIGIEDEVTLYSNEEDIFVYMPAKSLPNRTYRLFRSEALG